MKWFKKLTVLTLVCAVCLWSIPNVQIPTDSDISICNFEDRSDDVEEVY